jgi:hypothetical protein
MDKPHVNVSQEKGDILTWVNELRAWARGIVQDLRNSDKRCNDGKVRYIDRPGGERIFGDGPVYIKLVGKEAQFLKFDAPLPDNRSMYQNLRDAVDSNGNLNPEVAALGLLILSDSAQSQNNCRLIITYFEEVLKAGDLDQARSILKGEALTVLEMQKALQPIREYLDCAEAEQAEQLLDKIKSLLKAARKFRSEERKKGTEQAIDGRAHAELERAVRELTSKLGRPPFQKEITAETGLRPGVVRKQLISCGMPWIPAGSRGEDKSPRQTFR